MPRRYLLGPVGAHFVDQHLRRPVQAGECVAFDQAGTSGLAVGPADTWETVCARLPASWRPDFVVLYLPYTTVPACLWSAPVPLIGLAPDWYLLWHYYRRRLRSCDLILTDSVGVKTLAREGITPARPFNLFGCQRALLAGPPPTGPRDIDILFAGNLNPAVQRKQLPRLGWLARLGRHRRVAIYPGNFDATCRHFLGRARIVFNFSRHGECNQQAFEAAAAGALLFQEAGNTEVPAFFQDRKECIFYKAEDLEALLEHYLDHEDERRALAEAAQARVQHYSFEELWDNLLGQLDREWPVLGKQAGQRHSLTEIEELLVRSWQVLQSTSRADPTLARDLQLALRTHPRSSELHNALGLVHTRTVQGQGSAPVATEEAVGHFRRAVATQPCDLVAGLNLAEALAAAGNSMPAIDQARRTLDLVNSSAEPDPRFLEGGHFPPVFDQFRVEWERAAWTHAGRPADEARAKRELLRWRLHAFLAERTDDVTHHYEALLAFPELPSSRAALGLTLARRGHPAEAIMHLRQALAGNPFDRDTARALFDALGAEDDPEGQRSLAYDRRLLSQAAPHLVPTEGWFAAAGPGADGLASLIILCCNELEYTRLCLESVLRHTHCPYELVLVDNGSSDGTPAYLEKIRSRPGPARIEVIRNETNRGFPAGCNQALARARGSYVVFLNNDTLVGEGWLEDLIAWGIHDWPHVGLVGPVSNGAPAPQHVEVDYRDEAELEAFAARRRREYAGRWLEVKRLTGFCLLVRREVLDRIGGFDERFGLGFFDDDDLGVRAREAGFRMLLALNVFVHHFGSRTFRGLGLNTRQQLVNNFELFQAKWGPEYTKGYRLPEPPALLEAPAPSGLQDFHLVPSSPAASGTADTALSPVPNAVVKVPSAGPRRISLTMIVKNEEANLPDCLKSATDLVDETIVVDTGSHDQTKSVAARFGARVFDFPWVNDFAAARNEGLRHATGEWIFWLDADDRLDEENRRRLRALFASLRDEKDAYVMKIRSMLDGSRSVRLLDQVRLFPHHPQIWWQYRIHEQILPAVSQLGGKTRWTDVVIDHTGYQDASCRRGKLERNLQMLLLEEAEQPDEPFTLFNLGRTYLDLDRTTEALSIFRRSLERSKPNLSIVRKLYALITQGHLQLGQRLEALKVCREGQARYPDDPELLFQEAMLLREQKDFPEAEACLVRLVKTKPGEFFDMVDAGLRGYKARHHLAALYFDQGRLAEGEAQWRSALAERPGYTAAWLGLGEIFLAQKRWEELDQATRQIELPTPDGVDAAVLRARGHLARDEWQAARQVLEEAIRRAPQELRPRVLLTHALLREGRDWAGAEKALRHVLALAPEHAEAQQNLAVLLRRQRREMEV